MATKVLKCAAHGENTRLTCAECGDALCPRCLVRTAVGLKCASCARPAPVKVSGPPRRWRLVALVAGPVLLVAAAAIFLTGDDRRSGAGAGAGAKEDPVGSWTAAPDLSNLRGTAVALLLPDGRAVATGGGVGSIPLAATEVYDPDAGTWTNSGDLVQARRGHAGVVLGDGRILVSGGISEGELLASSEIYDPATGRWEATAAMTVPRLGHALTVLADGRVLATGGTTPEAQQGTAGGQTLGPDASTEMYTPATATWASAVPMRSARFEHTAVRLDDGRVLVAGGLGSRDGDLSPLGSTEVFDPAAGVFVESGRMAEGRTNHAAVKLEDGTVLAVGGAGGAGGDVALAAVERYDPRRGTWSRMEGMAHARTGATATLVGGGRVLVAGGEALERGVRRTLATAEVLDPDDGAWHPAGTMGCPRSEHAAVGLKDGSALIIAGDATFPGEPPIAQACAERYHP